MDNKIVINAVAGSGKTQLIIDCLSEKKRTCIITYTIANQLSLKERIKKNLDIFLKTSMYLDIGNFYIIFVLVL